MLDDITAPTADFEEYDLVEGQGEDEGDITSDPSSFVASVTSRDWTVETLVLQMRKGRIDLDPSFQRRNAWLDTRKSSLIESMLMGFPIPQIVLAEMADKPGYYFVLDGKQRLLSIRQFFADTDSPSDSSFDPLTLSGLLVLENLNGLRIGSTDFEQYVAELENYTIRTVLLSNWESRDMLLALFRRLNTGSLVLSTQELRQALISGGYTRWLDSASAESSMLGGLRRLLNTSGMPDRRMRDAELLHRYVSFKLFPYKYKGNLKEFLDTAAEYLNENWHQASGDIQSSAQRLGSAIDTGSAVMGKDFAKKFSGDTVEDGHFENRLNRAVLDVQAYAFAFPEVEAALKTSEPVGLMDGYKNSCVNDQAFSRAISTTTKTQAAFQLRHSVWRDLVRNHLEVDYPLPASLT